MAALGSKVYFEKKRFEFECLVKQKQKKSQVKLTIEEACETTYHL